MRLLARAGGVLAVLTLVATGVMIGAVGGGTATAAVTTSSPTRVLDTRTGMGARPGKVGPGEVLQLSLQSSVPAGTTAVVLNLTATEADGPGWAKAWPCGEAEPATSSLNFSPAHVAEANAVVVKLGAGATVCLSTYVAVHLVADLGGAFAGTGDFVGTSPNRIVDTRITGDPLHAGEVRRVKVAGTAGVPADAAIAALNVTVDAAPVDGWVRAYPCGSATSSSTVNFTAGETVATLTFVGLAGGDVCLESWNTADVVIDTYGWSTGTGDFRVQSPQRMLDTRDGSAWPYGRVQADSTIVLRVAGRNGVPNDANAGLVTVTVADTGGPGYVTAWPCDQPFPTSSTINTWPNQLRSNLALVQLAADGTVCFRLYSTNGSALSLIVDAVGWTTGGPARQAPPNAPLPPIGGSGNSADCRIANPAFCETFSSSAGSHPNLNPRTGDLDPVLWGVSRMGQSDDGHGQRNRIGNPTMNACGSSGVVAPAGDVRVCNGRLFEAVNDDHAVQNLDMYPKQPFDFTNRTGIATFDVGANSEGSHGAWPEWIITDKPVPGTRSDISNGGGTSGVNDVLPPFALNQFGFTVDGGCVAQNDTTGIGKMFVTRNGAFQELPMTQTGCVKKGDANNLNHFEVRISQNHVEVWGTDPGAAALQQLAVADNIDLTLTKGLVWINDAHYNAGKFPNPIGQRDHMFVWDNVGFDGPKTYRDIGYDVDDNRADATAETTDLGYFIGNGQSTFNVDNLGTAQTPSAAQVVLNFYSITEIPQLSVNGNPYIVSDPAQFKDSLQYLWRSISIPVPLTQLKPGNNTLTFKSTDGLMVVTNISLIFVAGAPVP